MKTVRCNTCGNLSQENPPCTICEKKSPSRIYIVFAIFHHKYSVCSNCWVNHLNPALRKLRKIARNIP